MSTNIYVTVTHYHIYDQHDQHDQHDQPAPHPANVENPAGNSHDGRDGWGYDGGMRFVTVVVLFLLVLAGCKREVDCSPPAPADTAERMAECLPEEPSLEDVQSRLVEWEYDGEVIEADLLPTSPTAELVLSYRANPQPPYDPQGKLAVLERTESGWQVAFESPDPEPDLESNGRDTLAGNWSFVLDQVADIQSDGGESILFHQRWSNMTHYSASYAKLLTVVDDRVQVLLVEDDFDDHLPTYVIDGPRIYSRSNFGNGTAITRTLMLENGRFVQTAETINPDAAELKVTLLDGTQFVSFDGECGWLCSHQYGLYRLDQGEQFHYDTPIVVRTIVQLRDGHVYVGGTDILRVAGDELHSITDDFSPLPEGHFFSVIDMEMTSTGEIWAANYLALVHFGHEQSTIYPLVAFNVAVAPDDSAWVLGWDGTADSNCCVYHVQDGVVTTYQKGEALPVSEELSAEIHGDQ
jgi:hypothetical protein